MPELSDHPAAGAAKDATAAPGLSIVLTPGPEPKNLEAVLDGLFAGEVRRPLELLVVAQGADEAVREALDRHRLRCFRRLLRLPPDACPARARNAGAAKARHPLVLFLDGRLVPGPDWLARAADALEASPELGALGAQAVAFRPDPRHGCHRPEPLDGPPDGPLAATGAFLLARRADWAAVEGFNPAYADGLDDLDFCLKLARDLGKACRPLDDLAGVPAAGLPEAPRDRRLLRERFARFLRERLAGDRPRTDPDRSGEKPATILFVLPGHHDSNNGNQVMLLARQLQDRDHRCLVAQPDPTPPQRDPSGVVVVGYDALLAERHTLFPNGAGPDLLHAWTPRETCRRLCETLLAQAPCPLVVHLEDNEALLTALALDTAVEALAGLSADELDRLVPPDRYHPVKGRRFLDRALGLTLVVAGLEAWNTGDLPSLVVAPQVDEALFFPRPADPAWRAAHGLDDGRLVLAYTGNSHQGNRDELIALYQAVALLNARGVPAVLARTGSDPEPIPVPPGHEHTVVHLGWLGRRAVPEVLAAADILVQPGWPGPFNDQRLPCKLPEYFAMGRPVILPRTNLGLLTRHGRDAYVLDRADAEGLAQAVAELARDRDLRQRLAAGAQAFYRDRYRTPVRRDYLAFLAGLGRPARAGSGGELEGLLKENDRLRFELAQARRDMEALCPGPDRLGRTP